MSAETLREAAKVLRERAKVATPGPWNVDGPFWVDPPGRPISELTVEVRAGVSGRGEARELVMAGTWDSKSDDAPYIATMHPGVGLALADWLDLAARRLNEGLGYPGDYEKPLTVASAILGGAS